MKKVALFVALVVIFGGLYSYVYLSNARNINALSGSNTAGKICQCEDPEKCKAEGICDGECEDTQDCSEETCQSVQFKVSESAPYVPPCCQLKETK